MVGDGKVNDVSGINETGIDQIMIDIVDACGQLKNNMNTINDIIVNSQNYFMGQAGDEFRQKFSKINSQFTILNDNILSYKSDLMQVKLSYMQMEQVASDDLKEASKKVGCK